MVNKKLRAMTLDAIFIAIMIVVNFLQFGFMQIFPSFSITILHVFVIIVALLGGYKRSAILGLTFGLLSLIMSYINPVTVLDPLFQNPLVSLLPRILFGIISGLLASLFIKKVSNNKAHLTLYSAVIAAISTVIHTILVIGSIYVFFNDAAIANLGDNFWFIIYLVLSTNGLLEVVLAAVITPIVVTALYKFSRRYYERLEG